MGTPLAIRVLEDGGSGGVGEEQVVGNLLDAPLFRVGDGVELGLRGVEVVQRGGEFAVKLLDGGVHRERILTWLM